MIGNRRVSMKKIARLRKDSMSEICMQIQFNNIIM